MKKFHTAVSSVSSLRFADSLGLRRNVLLLIKDESDVSRFSLERPIYRKHAWRISVAIIIPTKRPHHYRTSTNVVTEHRLGLDHNFSKVNSEFSAL